jgi:hypothetical protein
MLNLQSAIKDRVIRSKNHTGKELPEGLNNFKLVLKKWIFLAESNPKFVSNGNQKPSLAMLKNALNRTWAVLLCIQSIRLGRPGWKAIDNALDNLLLGLSSPIDDSSIAVGEYNRYLSTLKNDTLKPKMSAYVHIASDRTTLGASQAIIAFVVPYLLAKSKDICYFKISRSYLNELHSLVEKELSKIEQNAQTKQWIPRYHTARWQPSRPRWINMENDKTIRKLFYESQEISQEDLKSHILYYIENYLKTGSKFTLDPHLTKYEPSYEEWFKVDKTLLEPKQIGQIRREAIRGSFFLEIKCSFHKTSIKAIVRTVFDNFSRN